MTSGKAAGTLALCLLLASTGLLELSTTEPTPTAPLETTTLSFDDPGGAAELHQAKRTIHDGGSEDYYARYRLALGQMDRMSRYSTSAGRYRHPGPRSENHEAPTSGILAESWESLGPGNVGGRTRALLISPQDPTVLYAAGVSGGVWKTTTGGQTWAPLTDMLPNLAVSVLAMDPRDSNTIYAGTGEGHFRELVRGTGLPLRGAGIFRTSDAGDHWERLESTAGTDFHWVNDLIVSSRDSNRLYAATRSGVLRSLDAGQTWKQVFSTSLMGGCFDLVQRTDTASDFLLVSCGTFGQPTQAAIFRHPEAETELPWQLVYSEQGMGRTSLAIAPSQPRTVYALSASYLTGNNPNFNFNGGLHAIFRSDQGGAPGTWLARVRNTDSEKLNTLILSNPYVAYLNTCGFGQGPDRASNLGWYTNMIAVDPTNPEVLWAGGVDLFRSDDGGSNWGLVSYWWNSPPSIHADQHVLAFHPGYDGQDNQTLFVGGDGGVWRTDNALGQAGQGSQAACAVENSTVAWTSLNTNLGITQFYHGTPTPDGRSYLGGTQDNGTLLGEDEVGVNGWRHILGGDGGYVAVDPNRPQTIYAEAQNLNFFKSMDGGMTFASARNGINEAPGDVLFITPFLLDSSDSSRLWTGGKHVWRTDDGAANWTRASLPLTPLGGRVSALSNSPVNPDAVLVGRDDGRIFRSSTGLSAGAMTFWPNVRPQSGFISWIAHDPQDEETAYATYAGFGGKHVWKTTDGGINWNAIDGEGIAGLPDIPVHVIVVDPGDPQRLYLGTDLGVFVSTEGGQQWAVENTGFANTVTESLSLLVREGPAPELYAFTHGRGAWRVPLGNAPGCQPQRWISHVTGSGSGFTTRLFISNLGSETAAVRLVPYSEVGEPLTEAELQVEAGATFIERQDQVFEDPSVSHFGICGPPSAVVTVGYRIDDLPGATAHVSETLVQDQTFLLYPGEWGTIFDGIAAVNLGSEPAELIAILQDASGNEVARVTLNPALDPLAKQTAVLDFEFGSARGDVVRIESSQPILLLSLRGTIPGQGTMLLFQTEAISGTG